MDLISILELFKNIKLNEKQEYIYTEYVPKIAEITPEMLANKKLTKLITNTPNLIFKFKFIVIICYLAQKEDIFKNKLPMKNNLDSTGYFIAKMQDDFLDSVSEIENSFTVYLKNEVRENTFYLQNAVEVFTTLLGEQKLWKYKYIVSFNYTNSHSLNPMNEFYFYDNIHGSIRDSIYTTKEPSIIFGIDAFDSSFADYAYQFTKTYRQLTTNPHSQRYAKKKLPKSIKTISFFGHSLAEADYSYFHSIFDYYNIYINDINIYFYYNNYDKKADKRKEVSVNVIKLLTKYAENFDNTSIGRRKNLLHKLIIEKRLKLIDIYSMEYQNI